MNDTTELAALRADVSTAARWIAPAWPITSFVAVNPLGGLEHLPFDVACGEARRWFGARTHLPLSWYREAYAGAAISEAHLRYAIMTELAGLDWLAPIDVGGREVDPVQVLLRDLVCGPTGPIEGAGVSDDRVASVVSYVGSWCAAFVDQTHVPIEMQHRELGFFRAWKRAATTDPRLRQLVGRRARAWIGELPDDPAAALRLAFETLCITPVDHLDALRAMLAKLPGWAGHARWSDEWAPADRRGPRLSMIDLAAVLAVLEAAAGERLLSCPPEVDTPDRDLIRRRIEASIAAFDAGSDRGASRSIGELIERVPDAKRAMIWLAAHEAAFRDGLLGDMEVVDPGIPTSRPAAQLVACIDVRSEALRRNLEALGDYETFGFAGFFGVPVRWRPKGSDLAEARCPVLVTPTYEVAERSASPGAAVADRPAVAKAAHAALHDTKGALGSPFALAESAGWLLGPIAAARTVSGRIGRQGSAQRRRASEPSDLLVDADADPVSGLPLERRVLFAEAIITTINLDRFARLVVLCGHASKTVNNPHASALDCGACGGAPGGPSARIAAAILNDPAVRAGLAERGISIPDDTWFVPAEHDTAADHVELLDRHLVPAELDDELARLAAHLEVAGQRTAAERAARLPGDPRRVRERGTDWAQVRPEWGLAGNAAFVAGPRSITEGLDLRGRVFLHSYQAEADPEGVALETIMTAPLIVAQWISSQYYFSTVAPETFGAGDKMLHNPVGGVGVLRGEAGDLAIGLPMQSVMVGEQLAHEPLRLLAVVQAPLERIEAIIQRNRNLRHLVEHSWISVAARSHGHEPWSLRTPAGTWNTWHAATDAPAIPATLEIT